MLSAYFSFASKVPRMVDWLLSVASILSKIASVILCSVSSASAQSPLAALVAWTRSLRPKLAASPRAAPAAAAPMRALVLPSPQLNALLSPLDLWVVDFCPPERLRELSRFLD